MVEPRSNSGPCTNCRLATPGRVGEAKTEDWERQRAAGPDMDAEMEKRRSEVIGWLNSLFPDLNMPLEASEEELRARLLDGALLCGIFKRFSPGHSEEIRNDNCVSTENRLENIRKFIADVERAGLPSFKVSDLEQGPLSSVVHCLWSLKNHLLSDAGEERDMNSTVKSPGKALIRWKSLEDRQDPLRGNNIPKGQSSAVFGDDRRRHSFRESKLQRVLRSPVMSEPSTPSQHSGRKFHEVFQLKQGHYYDLPAAKISEMMKSNSLDNAPTQSLLSVVNGILDESIERKNGELPQRVACLLRKVVQEIERRISTQAEHIRNQNNLIKAREEKYQSRIRVLETLANGTTDETQIVMNQLQLLKTEKHKIEERNKHGEEDMARLTKEKEKSNQIISELNQELEMIKKTYGEQVQQMETTRTTKEKEQSDQIISELKQEIEMIKKTYGEQFQQMEIKAKEYQIELEKNLKDAESFLAESRRRIKELETDSESKFRNWNQREHVFQTFMDLQQQSVQNLRSSSDSIKHEVKITQNRWCEELTSFGKQMKVLTDAVENYNSVLAENRRLYNEVQELKGNIRVYCRVRPFLPGENRKQSTIEYLGENGEVLIINPSKPGKDGQRMFKFNKAYGQATTQEEVFKDTQPLVRSVLDGYNVCIFAYGQTGSGKTYTMTGPEKATEKEWGVNYRALNDLFQISREREDAYQYEVGVQMVEIYNETVRDLLGNGGSQKRLGVLTTSQPNGLAVPDASMLPVKATSDVLQLMQLGHGNRAVSATSLNERSSRSHSIVTVHVRGTDLRTGNILRGSLHLIDLAGSERVDRSEVTGDRLKEAAHINKSLAALGDVIFALAQKNAHVPYRNSKLTQVLQSSLGGHAKTLMFVQINPDISSFSESLSTLKFAERVSGVELGAAKSQKEGKDVRDLMEQVSSLKDTIARKDEEIDQLQQTKDIRSRNGSSSMKHPSSVLGGTIQQEQMSENSGDESLGQPKLDGEVADESTTADLGLLGDGDADSEDRLSDTSEGGLSMGTETDSIGSVDPEQVKSSETTKEKAPRTPTRVPKPTPLKSTASRTKSKEPPKSPSARNATSPVATAFSSKSPKVPGRAPAK